MIDYRRRSLGEGFPSSTRSHPSFNPVYRFSPRQLTSNISVFTGPQTRALVFYSFYLAWEAAFIISQSLPTPPTDISAVSTLSAVMEASAREYVGERFSVGWIKRKEDGRFKPQWDGFATFEERSIYFITRIWRLNAGSTYGLEEAVLDSLPQKQQVLRIISATEVSK